LYKNQTSKINLLFCYQLNLSGRLLVFGEITITEYIYIYKTITKIDCLLFYFKIGNNQDVQNINLLFKSNNFVQYDSVRIK